MPLDPAPYPDAIDALDEAVAGEKILAVDDTMRRRILVALRDQIGNLDTQLRTYGALDTSRGPLAVYTPPLNAVQLDPGDLTQATLAAHPTGTYFALAGEHRLTEQLFPLAGQVIDAHPGARVNCSKVLTGWSASTHGGTPVWSVIGQTQRITPVYSNNDCLVGYPRCGHPEALFFDDVPLLHVASLDDVAPGSWFFDYDTSTIWIGDDPDGHTVETTVVGVAFKGNTDRTEQPGVVLRNFTIEKAGTPLQHGAVWTQFSTDWLLEHLDVRLCAGAGVMLDGNRSTLRRSRILDIGQLGVGGSTRVNGTFDDAQDIMVDDVLLDGGGWSGVNPGWESAASKFVNTTRLTWRNFEVRDWVAGVWTDHDNLDTLYEDFLIVDCGRFGLFHEVSHDAEIRDGTITGCGYDEPAATWAFGAGIQLANVRNVHAHRLTLDDNRNGITVIQQERPDFDGSVRGPAAFHATTNVLVNDYSVRSSHADGKSGALQDFDNAGANSMHAAAANIRFRDGHWRVPAGQSHWAWDGALRDWAAWQGYGHDA